MDSEFAQDDYTVEPEGVNWQPFSEYGFNSPWAPRLWKASIGTNYLISTITTLTIVIAFAAIFTQCRHWCLIPIILCGILTGEYLVAWLRGEMDTFDSKSLVGAVLYVHCFLAPLIHLVYSTYPPEWYMSNWPTYFGYMACFNAAGVVLLKLGHNMFFKSSRPARSFWQMAPDRFVGMLIPVLVISLAASAVIRFVFGGGGRGIFITGVAHLSWLKMLGDPAPTLITMAIIYWISCKNVGKQTSFVAVMLILLFLAAFQFFWVGLRGSRSAVLWAVLIAATIVHYRLRRISIWLILVGLCVLFLFSYLYSFYKHLGPKGWQAFYSAEARKSMLYERPGLGAKTIFLGYAAKADLQAFMLYRLVEHKEEYRPIYGQTYLMSVLTFIPRGIWKTKPALIKGRAGGRIQGLGDVRSSRVYGLAGEAMLNFSYYGILPAFCIFGCFLGWFRKKVATLEPSDSRFFVIPLLLLVFVLGISGDSGSWMFGLLKMGVLPFLVVFLGSIRTKFASDYTEVS